MDLFVNLFNTVITHPLFNLLMMLYYWLGDFGLAIVVLTALIWLLFLPLTLRQFRTARVMRRLQPQLTSIRQQFARDKSSQTQATQALYREHGIHPSSSLLSLLLQTPIYSGLYFALNTVLQASSVGAINRLMYPFLVHFTALPNINLLWFTVLNASLHISLAIPDPTHLLPLLTGALTFVQMRMAQPASLTETREALMNVSQGMQFLLLLVPVGLTIVIAWQFAAGLALYRFVSIALNMIMQYFMTGWGSLWKLPEMGFAGNSIPPVREQLTQVSPSSRTRKRRRSSSFSRRGKRPGRKR